ncbi:MAG: hypothetical protein V4850_24530 [Myxococcota bacterium]
MFGILASFKHKAEIRESKDEILVGELVRAMARQGYPACGFAAHADWQRVQFRAAGDPVLHAVHLTLNRMTGSSAISEALLGSQATLTVTAEVKNLVADPDDLIAMYRTDLANLFKMPALGGIKLNHEMNSVFATTTKYIDIGAYVMRGEPGADALVKLLDGTIDALRERLRTYKR